MSPTRSLGYRLNVLRVCGVRRLRSVRSTSTEYYCVHGLYGVQVAYKWQSWETLILLQPRYAVLRIVIFLLL